MNIVHQDLPVRCKLRSGVRGEIYTYVNNGNGADLRYLPGQLMLESPMREGDK